MTEVHSTDVDLSKVLEDQSETVSLIAGKKHLRQWNAGSKGRSAALIVSEQNLYIAGTYFDRHDDIYTKNNGRVVVSIKDVSGLSKSKKPLNRLIKPIGQGLFFGGLAILAAGLIEGSVMGIVAALFIGAAWLMVPGGLMLAYARSGGEFVLNIQHSNGTISLPYDSYSTEEMDNLQKIFGDVASTPSDASV